MSCASDGCSCKRNISSANNATPEARKMAQVARMLRAHHQCSTLLLHLFSPTLAIKASSSSRQQHQRFFFASLTQSQVRAHSVRLPRTSVPSGIREDDSDSEVPIKKSRNQKKREARRAVRWGMELATFTTPQIKRILKVVSLEREVFEALVLVKRMGPDVREGKRRQFNYIGRLLREVQPDLMDGLIQAMKDGDQNKLQALANTGTWIDEDDEEVWEESEDEEDGGRLYYIDVASRWFEGLIDKDMDITSEVYAIHNIEFDRQELRKLVRRVQSMKDEQQLNGENGEGDAALVRAEKSLSRFLRTLAKQLTAE